MTMRKKCIQILFSFILAVVISGISSNIAAAAPSSFQVDFNHRNFGDIYTRSMANADFGDVSYFHAGSDNRLRVYGTSDRHLRATYPAGGVATSTSGGQFKAKLDPGTEYTLEYKVKFDPDFQWVKGGKLPGLCGGDCNTGGSQPDGNGFSSRFMWRSNGELVVYLYHMDQAGIFGEDISTGVWMAKDQWVTIKQRVKLNTGNNANGQLQVWVNGLQKINRNNVRYMTNGSKRIDTFYFSTFHGGNDPSWAPSSTVYARFDDIVAQKLN